ncbi:MAG: hypothetical protein LBB23_00815 [Rickettsiales bacterium]|jgi:hypothetical protein|nr:hypothetical protein [Rickettsiales bacterium]
MIQDLQNYKIDDLSNIDKLPQDVQFRIYKALNTKFHNSPMLCGESFQKISDEEIRIFGIHYTPSQILVIGPDGQKTLDGNKSYYYLPKYKFSKDDNKYIQNKFGRFVELGKEYNINIGQVAIVPVKYKEDEFAKCVGQAIPEAYDFSNADEPCCVLCVPFEGRDQALISGVFSDCRLSVGDFAWCAGIILMNYAGVNTAFQGAVRLALEQVQKTR